MAEGGEASRKKGEGEGVGKVRRVRKAPSTPYDRPYEHPRWISRVVVEPAKRLLSGGATLLLPSLFSPSPSPLTTPRSEELEAEVHDITQEEEEEEEEEEEDHNEIQTSSIAVGNLNPHPSYNVQLDERRELSDGDGGLPDIEHLIKGNKFSSQEIHHLVEVLRSREGKAPAFTKTQGVEISKGKHKVSIVEGEQTDRLRLASTPLRRPSCSLPKGQKNFKLASNGLQKLRGEIGASPVDIARAYMGSRTSEAGLTPVSLTLKNEKRGSISEFPSKSIMPSPLPKAPICWPGAVTQNQQGYSTPPNQKSRYGVQSFSRTPYSRTMYTKSKSKLTPLRGDSDRLSNILSTPLQPKETAGYGKSISIATQDSYGSGGPMRRPRNKFGSAAPTRESPLGRSVHRSSFAKEFNADDMIKNKHEHGSLGTTIFEPSKSNYQGSEVSTPNVHPHSSKLARQILEHIDRPVTLKEKSKELKLATSFKNSPAAAALSLPGVETSNPGNAGIGDRKSFDLSSSNLYSQSNGGIYGLSRGKSDNVDSQIRKDVASSSKLNLDKTSAVSDGIDDSALNYPKLDSQSKSSEQATEKKLLASNTLPGDGSKGVDIIPNSSKSESPNAQRKPFLSSIAVGKSGVRNPFTSDTSAGFSFPVTTSSNTYFDLPTPTVMPSSLTSSPQKPDVSTTDKKITIAPPVYSLPPTSTTSIQTDVVTPKFKFGSGKTRLSFAVDGDDGTSTSVDAPSISYKFGTGKSSLNFGSTASYAVCG